MAAMTLGAATINQGRNQLSLALGGATGALTITSPGITVTVGGVSAAIGTITTTGSGATAKVIIPLSAVAAIGAAIIITTLSSGIVDSLTNTTPNGSVTVTDATYILALASATINKSRNQLTVAVSGATGALTLATDNISVTVGGVLASIGTITTTGTGSTAALVIPLSAVAQVGQAIVVTAAASGIHDTVSAEIANSSLIVTDPASAAQTFNMAQVQAAAANCPLLTQLQQGFFGGAKTTDGIHFDVFMPGAARPFVRLVVDTSQGGTPILQAILPVPV